MTSLRITLVFAAAFLTALGHAPAHAAGDSAFDPQTGYRIAHYRAAVPATVPGGTRVDLDTVDRLIKDGIQLLDVMASTGAGLNAETGQWQLANPHRSIPGAVWLPDVGRGQLKPIIQSYLESNLTRLSGGDREKPILVFCQSDCWMGWNAVQRIAKLGYKRIYWYPEGTDGWMEWGDRTLAVVEPVPVSPPPAPAP